MLQNYDIFTRLQHSCLEGFQFVAVVRGRSIDFLQSRPFEIDLKELLLSVDELIKLCYVLFLVFGKRTYQIFDSVNFELSKLVLLDKAVMQHIESLEGFLELETIYPFIEVNSLIYHVLDESYQLFLSIIDISILTQQTIRQPLLLL